MSVLDQLRDIERQVVGRLSELEPLVREYEQLRRAAERLGVKYDPRSAAADGDQPAARRRHRGGRATPRSSSGKRASAAATTERAARPATRASRSRKPNGSAKRAAQRRRAASPGQRQQQMLGLVTEQPGITVAAIAQRLGIDATGLYRVMRRLTESGQIRKDGRRLYPSDQPQTREPTEATTPGSKIGSRPNPETGEHAAK